MTTESYARMDGSMMNLVQSIWGDLRCSAFMEVVADARHGEVAQELSRSAISEHLELQRSVVRGQIDLECPVDICPGASATLFVEKAVTRRCVLTGRRSTPFRRR